MFRHGRFEIRTICNTNRRGPREKLEHQEINNGGMAVRSIIFGLAGLTTVRQTAHDQQINSYLVNWINIQIIH
jgi:hypothetical protein